jgi:antirestriction protein ArdC
VNPDTIALRGQMLEDLWNQSEELESSDGWLAWLKFARRFRRYSVANQLLIKSQRPEATFVAGFRTWNELGRRIKPGEQAISIFAPRLGTAPPEDASETSGKVLMGFRSVGVYDITQTEGAPLPLIDVPRVQMSEEALFSQLVIVAHKAEITVLVVEEGPEGVLGWWNRDSRTIKIVREDDLANMTATLLHELGHACDPLAGNPDTVKAERELVAESAAYLVGAELDVEMRDAAAFYLMVIGANRVRRLEMADEVMAAANRLSALTAELPLPLGS